MNHTWSMKKLMASVSPNNASFLLNTDYLGECCHGVTTQPPPYPTSGCCRNQLHSIAPEKLRQAKTGSLTSSQGASGRSDFGYSGTIWQVAHQTAGALWLTLDVHLKSAQSLAAAASSVWDQQDTAPSHSSHESNHLPWVVLHPKACPLKSFLRKF